MRRSSLAWVVLVAIGGCGGSSQKWVEEKPAPPTAEELASRKAAAEREQLDRERPKSPLVEKRREGFRTADRCGQGPYRLEVESLSARYGESLEVYVCGPHTVAGAYRMTVKQKYAEERSHESTYGWSGPDNRECVAGAEERAALGPVAGERKSAPAGKPSGKVRGKPAAVAETNKRAELRTLDATIAPVDCKVKTTILQHGWTTSDGVALSSAHISLELWSEQPNDLTGAVFVVLQRAVSEAMTPEKWAAHQEAERAWYERYRVFIDGELRAGRTRLVDTTVKAPPPPPPRKEAPPPRPSTHATWIPGYWHFEDGAYHWLAGLWRVPPEDLRAELTAQAPRPPPPPRAEDVQPRAAAPSRSAVWTPGSWQWDGDAGAWVWIDGTWRIPPEQGQVWTPATWEMRLGGGVRLRPGGWTIRLRR